jgi:hypothetical protein
MTRSNSLFCRRSCLALGIVLGALLMVSPRPAAASDISWKDNYAIGLDAMQRENRPGMIYFFNYRARPCREMMQRTFADPEIAQRLQGFVSIGLVENENRELSRRFNLFKVPTVIFIDPMGREIDRTVGFKEPSEFAIYLDRILGEYAPDGALTNATSSEDIKFEDLAIDITQPRENTIPVEFRFYSPLSDRIFLTGDFVDWRVDALQMTLAQAGDFRTTVYLPKGVYEYKYYDPATSEYIEDPENPYRKANTFGTLNSMLLLGENPPQSPIVDRGGVTFILYNEDAETIEVAGNFTNWQRVVMFRNPEDPAMWGVRYPLPPGTYHYKYVINGEWGTDPENYSPVDDGNGNKNSTFTISY